VAQVTAQQVAAAEATLVAAKKAKGSAKSGVKVDEYRAAADQLTSVRTAFRQQEEQAGRRVGFVSGDAAEGQ
jgi:hypothetical protein